MKGKDSYPPAEVGDSCNYSDEQAAPDGSEEKSCDDGEDVRKPENWDGSEAEIVLDNETEEYEEETTGIKVKYALKPEETEKFIKHSESYQKTKKSQKTHTAIQSAVLASMIVFALITGILWYWWITALPAAALVIIWLVPFLGIKKTVRELTGNEQITVEVFPDKIEITGPDYKKEILLNDSCESEEYEDMIVIFYKNNLSLIIPLRAVEPEFRPEFQAMIFAGAKPRHKV